MSNRETYSEIHRTLDGFNAPRDPALISDRIRGIIGPAAAALHAAGIVVGDGTLAEAIGLLAKERATDSAIAEQVIRERDEAADRFLLAIAEEQQRTVEAIRALAERDERVRIAEARADRMDAQWSAAERQRDQWQQRALAAEEASEKERERSVSAAIANREILDDLANLRAATDRQRAQLDYATDLLTAAMRARS